MSAAERPSGAGGRRDAGPVPRRARRTAGARPRRSPGAIAASVVLHGALTLFLVQALRLPTPLGALFTRAPAEQPVEHLTYVQPADRSAPPAEPSRPPVARRAPAAPTAPVRPAPRAAPPRLVAPSAVPDGVAPPSASPSTPTRVDDGRGAVGGAAVGELGGAAAGLRPTYVPGPVWRRPLFDWEQPTTLDERLDSAVTGDLAAVRDSLIREALRRRPGDWTVQRNGQKYGIDEQFIRLGPISIPTALLGAIPMRQQGANAIDMQRARTTQALGNEAREQGLRRVADDDFDARVQSIRARRDRERAERRARDAARSTPPPDR